MASPAAGDGNQPSPVHTLSAEERIIRSLNPSKKSFRRPPKFTNEPPPDVQLPSPRIKPNHSHTDPPSQIQPHANQPTTSTAAILSKLQQPSLTSNAVSEQKEMAITGDINDHECCREIAKSPLHSLEDGEESFARDKLILTSPADENGNHPPPAPPPTSRNEPSFLRRSQRQTRSKYKSQTLAQQPPTSANTPPSSSLQQPSPTAILTPPTTISKLSSQANQPLASSPQPTQATHHSGEHPAVTPNLVNGFSPQNNQPPASSLQPTQATHHSGDHPAVTAAIHHQNQPVLHGQLPQDSVQATTTSQPQSPPTQTTPTRQKATCKSQASTRNNAHGQLQLSTKSQLHTTIIEPSESQQASNQLQLKSLHTGGNFHAHGIFRQLKNCVPHVCLPLALPMPH